MHKGELKSFRRNTIGVIFFGLIFLACQVYEFAHFTNEGLTLSTNTFGSTFYMMTGTHGVHVAIGVFWLLCLYFYSYSGKMDAHESAVDVDGGWVMLALCRYRLDYHFYGSLSHRIHTRTTVVFLP